MADRPNRIGQQLGNYRLIRLLGQGGFAEVYLGEHIHLGTKAAIKVLHTQLTHEDVDAFRTEARTIAHLIHPHIVRVLDFGVEGQTPFLVMDYAPYGTLRHLHPKDTSLPLATIVTYIKQVADALQYAHDEKLIHRDIKPENMLVGERNEVFLSDFGIALVAQSSRHQSTQEVIGTVTYMSPEQIQGKPRPASDQYSLGIVVYEWLCGDRPFHGSFTELCTQHMFAPPPPLHEKIPTLSPDVEHVVMTALAKDPKQRFDSIRAFATALEQANRLTPSQPPRSARGVTPPSEPLPLTILATPPHRVPESTTEAPPPNLSAQRVDAARTQQPLSSSSSTILSKMMISLMPSTPKPGISRSRIILLIGLTLLLIVASVGLVAIVRSNQTTADNAIATSQAKANGRASRTTDDASSLQVLYNQATAENPTLDDQLNSQSASNWDEYTQAGYSCTFIGNAYHAIMQQTNYITMCLAHATNFSNFAFQVQMIIIKGNAGGLIFCADTGGSKMYRFMTSQDGNYDLISTNASNNIGRLTGYESSSAIKTGLNQPNLLTVIARRSHFYLYINGQYVNSATDSTTSSGEIGLFAWDSGNPTEVVFSNAKVWTL